MKRLIPLVALFVSGCASISYGPLQVRTLGTDVTFEEAAWMKKSTDGSVEALYVKGGKKDASTSTHTAANTALAALGALIGSPAGVAGASAGSAAGLSLSEIWQSVQDYLAKPPSAAPVPSPQVAPAAPAAPAVSSFILIQPPYDQAYMDVNGRAEEVGLEAQEGLIVRCVVIRPGIGNWVLSTPFVGHIRRNGDVIQADQDFTFQNGIYHLRGWSRIKPQATDTDPVIETDTTSISWGQFKYAIWEIRSK